MENMEFPNGLVEGVTDLTIDRFNVTSFVCVRERQYFIIVYPPVDGQGFGSAYLYAADGYGMCKTETIGKGGFLDKLIKAINQLPQFQEILQKARKKESYNIRFELFMDDE